MKNIIMFKILDFVDMPLENFEVDLLTKVKYELESRSWSCTDIKSGYLYACTSCMLEKPKHLSVFSPLKARDGSYWSSITCDNIVSSWRRIFKKESKWNTGEDLQKLCETVFDILNGYPNLTEILRIEPSELLKVERGLGLNLSPLPKRIKDDD